jgi:putative peptide zinc metalloprotease protein
MLGVVLPLMAGALILGRLGFRFFRGLALWSEDSTPKRIAAAVLTFAVISGLSWAWWPDPFTYRPIQPGERGLVTSVVQLQETAHTEGAAGTAAQTRLSSSRPLVAAFPEGQALPTEDDPVLALVLVPTDGEPDDTWVLPFDKPLPPAEGDNQALAVNTTDGSVTYDLAFAMVWAEGDEVLNVNEAHA